MKHDGEVREEEFSSKSEWKRLVMEVKVDTSKFGSFAKNTRMTFCHIQYMSAFLPHASFSSGAN